MIDPFAIINIQSKHFTFGSVQVKNERLWLFLDKSSLFVYKNNEPLLEFG